MEEQRSIVKLKQGDISGLEYLVRKYYGQAVRAAYLVVQDQSLAEDIVQTCFLNASKKIGLFDSTKEFRPWFLRSVINYSISESRKRSRTFSIDEIGIHDPNRLSLDWLSGVQTGPEEDLISEETRQAVWAALGRLSIQQRAAVVMRYYLDFKEVEIKQELDKPLSTVKWLLYSARARLRRLLSSLYASDDASKPIRIEENK